MKEQFFNHEGKCFASLCGDILRKSEREEDRLRMTGGRAYAIDVYVLRKAYSQGAKFLEIHEKTVNNAKRVFKIPISDIYCFGQEINIKGIERWTIPLEACELKQGPDEPWRVEARKALLKGEGSNTRSQLALKLDVSTLEIMNQYGSDLWVYEEKINPVRTQRVKGDERYGCRDQKNR